MTDERSKLIRYRIISALADGEEFLEEIYLLVNFDLQEQRELARSRFHYAAYYETFRLAEIMEQLAVMTQDGLIIAHVVPGFAESCGPTAQMFALTEAGLALWKNKVQTCAQLFDPAPRE